MQDSPKTAYEVFEKGIWRENPVFVQVMGMCPMLAVTNSVVNALAMGAVTFFVLTGSSFLVSLFRHLIPNLHLPVNGFHGFRQPVQLRLMKSS